MPDLRDTRRKMKIVIGALAGVSVAAAGLLVSPLVGSAAQRQQDMNQLRAQLTTKNREVEPLRGIDKKIPLATKQIDEFYRERFASHDSEVAEALETLAKESNVKIQSAKYKVGDAESVGLRREEIETAVQGDYQPIARFLNGLERSKIFFIINGIALAPQNGPLQLQLKLETFQKVGG